MRSARLVRAVAFAVFCIVMIATLSGCWRAKSAATPALPSATGSVSNDTSPSGSATATAATKNAAPVGAPGSAGGSVASGPSSSTSPGKKAATPKTGTAIPSVTDKGMQIQLIWWNDTKSKPTASWQIVYGSTIIKPSGATGKAAFGPIPFNKSAELVIYPDGPKGKKIVAPFTVTADMQPNSEQDAIHVEVSDSGVRVLGNPMHNVDQTYPRY